MEKDIHVLVETTNPEIFEEQAECWPGITVFRQFAWNCRCGEDNCFMKCCQYFAREFPTIADFEAYLEGIVGIKSWAELADFTNNFGKNRAMKAMN